MAKPGEFYIPTDPEGTAKLNAWLEEQRMAAAGQAPASPAPTSTHVAPPIDPRSRRAPVNPEVAKALPGALESMGIEAPVRQGETIPGALITDKGEMAPSYAYTGPGIGRGGPPPGPKLPDGLVGHDGQYFGSDPKTGGDYAARVMGMLERGEIDIDQANAALEKWRKHLRTPAGIGETIDRSTFASHQAELDGERQALDRDAWAANLEKLQIQHAARKEQESYDRDQRNRAEYEQVYNQEIGRYQQAIGSLNATKIDPHRYFKTPQGVISALGMTLMAIGSGLARTENTGLKLLESTLQNEIQAQSRELDAKTAAVGEQRNLLGFMRQHFEDKQQAEMATRAAIYGQLERRMLLVAKQREGEEMGRRAELLADELGRRRFRLEKGIELDASVRAQVIMNQRIAAQNALAQQRARRAREAEYGVELGKEEESRVIPGVGVALPGSDIKELRASVATHRDVVNLIGQAQAIMAKHARGIPLSPTERATLAMAQSRVATPEIKKYAGAAVSDAELERIQASLGGDWLAIGDNLIVDRIKILGQLRGAVNSQMRNSLGANVIQGETTRAQDEKGRTRWYFKEGEEPGQGAEIQPGAAPR